jgi:hypothetical protein
MAASYKTSYARKIRLQLIAGGSMHLIGFDQIGNKRDPPGGVVPTSGPIRT